MDVADDFFNMNLKGLNSEEKINKLVNFYKQLPEPRTEIHGSYLFVYKIGFLALANGNYDLAEEWGLIGLKYKGIYGLLGEEEFFLGQVYFAKGDMDKAKEYFTKVYENSKTRLFREENPEYLKLIGKK